MCHCAKPRDPEAQVLQDDEMSNDTILSQQEKKWILERRITRLSDNKEVQIYPMGAERYLSSVLFNLKNAVESATSGYCTDSLRDCDDSTAFFRFKNQKNDYAISTDIEGKDVLVIPGYGNSGFLF